MKVQFVVEGGFGGSGTTDLIVYEDSIILMNVNGQQIAINLTPSQIRLLVSTLNAK